MNAGSAWLLSGGEHHHGHGHGQSQGHAHHDQDHGDKTHCVEIDRGVGTLSVFEDGRSACFRCDVRERS